MKHLLFKNDHSLMAGPSNSMKLHIPPENRIYLLVNNNIYPFLNSRTYRNEISQVHFLSTMHKMKWRSSLDAFFPYKAYDESMYHTLPHWSSYQNVLLWKNIEIMSITQVEIWKVSLWQKCHTNKKWRFSSKGQHLWTKYYVNVPVLYSAFYISCWSRTTAKCMWNLIHFDWF